MVRVTDSLLDELKASELILPGFSYVGSNFEDALYIMTCGNVDKITVGIYDENPEPINLSEIAFFDTDGRILNRDNVCSNFDISSQLPGKTVDDVRKDFNMCRLIHSDREVSPSISISISNPKVVHSIAIRNRSDKWGWRSRSLFVYGYFRNKKVILWSADDPARRVERFHEVCEILHIEWPRDFSDAGLKKWHRLFRKIVVDMIRCGAFPRDDRIIIDLLPVYDGTGDFDEFTCLLCAQAMINKTLGGESCATYKLNFLSNILTCGTRMEFALSSANDLIRKRVGGSPLVISKHEINYSTLSENRQSYLMAISKAVSIFDGFGARLVLCYGTLLGAIREGDFLPHDDDVDLLYIDNSMSKSEMIDNKSKLIEKLKSIGVKVWGIDSEKNFHIHLDGVDLDIFPCWKSENKIYLLMEGMRYRDIAEPIIGSGNATRPMLGFDFPVPEMPEAFLEDRYGDDWNVSNPYYEWPWPVDQNK